MDRTRDSRLGWHGKQAVTRVKVLSKIEKSVGSREPIFSFMVRDHTIRANDEYNRTTLAGGDFLPPPASADTRPAVDLTTDRTAALPFARCAHARSVYNSSLSQEAHTARTSSFFCWRAQRKESHIPTRQHRRNTNGGEAGGQRLPGTTLKKNTKGSRKRVALILPLSLESRPRGGDEE